MKSIVTNNIPEINVKPFPKLMNVIGEETNVVLFTNERCGIVVSGTHNWNKIGMESNSWMTSSFEEFKGSVTLSND